MDEDREERVTDLERDGSPAKAWDEEKRKRFHNRMRLLDEAGVSRARQRIVRIVEFTCAWLAVLGVAVLIGGLFVADTTP